MPEVMKTKLDGVLLIKPEVFGDHRGEYVELYNEYVYVKAGVRVKFVQDDISVSVKNVLRGIHGDTKTWKLVSCLLGRFYLVIINCDEFSSEFRQWESFSLTDKTRHQVLVPPKFGVAHLALTDKIIFHYKQSTYYDPSSQFTYKWNDPKFNICWPIKNPILSKRDEAGHYV
jgi:dTDP-4-dehydrorhamnose 3,5-epimerase